MKTFSILGGLMLATLVITPATVTAEDHRGEVCYYDPDGRDYHTWNAKKTAITRHEHGFKVEVR